MFAPCLVSRSIMVSKRRERMLETGQELLLRRGYAGLGLRELLDAVEVSKGAFYHFFPSKEAFALAVLDQHLNRKLDGLRAHFTGPVHLPMLLDWLRTDWHAQLAADFVPRCLVRRLAGDIGSGIPEEPVRAAMNSLASALAGAIANGQQVGSLYLDLDATAAAWHILDLWHGASTRALALRDDSAPRAAIVHLEAWLKP